MRLVRSVWAHLPTQLRRAAFHGAVAALQPKLSAVSRDLVLDRKVPRIVVGCLSAATGLGQSARLTAMALRSQGYEVLGIDVSSYFYDYDETVAHGLPDARNHKGPGHAIVVVNAPYMPYVLTLLGRSFLDEKWVTAYWAWELERLPPGWIKGFACAHDIAVPSAFVARAVKSVGLPVQVVVAPHPVACDPMPPSPFAADASRPDSPFTVITVANLSSNFARKNPIAVIQAYRLAFGRSRDCRLRMRLTGASAPQQHAVLEAIGDSDTIDVEWQAGPRAAVCSWWGTPDVYAALHRAEGFGLPIAEAMLAGYPALATGWSGNMEFMSDDTAFPVGYRLRPVDDPEARYSGFGASWAEPDVAHAAALLQRLYKDRELIRGVARKAHEAARRLLSARSFVRNLVSEDQSAALVAAS